MLIDSGPSVRLPVNLKSLVLTVPLSVNLTLPPPPPQVVEGSPTLTPPMFAVVEFVVGG